MDPYKPYAADTRWTFRTLRGSYEPTMPLHLWYEVNGASISDEYTPAEISARELWSRWYSEFAKASPVKVYWSIAGGNNIFEALPFSPTHTLSEDFLTHYTWPVNADTGERLNFARLLVADKQWNAERGDKGGFIQELTGWKPSPYQSLFDAETIAKAAGLDRL
ncbi:hypothetical protein ACFW9N_37100 [Streptomyces sp. NPDC059496]|uniref:hypothetical protein n=1 Tax=Streptomyces sp. NPDC059496 TaxID=3346851 RepID=UPI00369C5499